MLKDVLKPEFLGQTFKNIYSDTRGGIPTTVFGVSFAEKCQIASMLNCPILYITVSSVEAFKVAEEISELTGEQAVCLTAKDDVLLFKRAFNKDRLYSRLQALYEIKKGAKYVVTTGEALMELFPKEIRAIELEKNGEYDLYNLSEKLVEMGYKRVEEVETKGEFSIRGDIMNVFSISLDYPVRLDFFGDFLENIKNVDSGEELDKIEILQSTDVIVERGEEREIISLLNKELKSFKNVVAADKSRQICDVITEVLEAGGKDDCLQFIMPLLKNVTSNIFEYVDENSIVVYDECKNLHDNLKFLEKEHFDRLSSLKNTGECFSFSTKQMCTVDELLSKLNAKRTLGVSTLMTASGLFNALKQYTVKCSPLSRYAMREQDLYTDIRNWTFNGYRVLLCCGSDNKADRLNYLLDINKIEGKVCETFDGSFTGVKVTPFLLNSGFVYHEGKIAVIGTSDLYFKISDKSKTVKKKRGEVFTAPEVGDFAVHEHYGVGLVKGVKRITTQEGSKDYVELEYAGGDRLYVCTDNMEKLSKYLGDDHPTLSKIGGGEFERVKERVRAAIAKMTINLKKLYSERRNKKGYRFSPDNELSEEFASAFGFEETEDQLSSIEEISEDMESDKVMDRLLCGDVGFGKTEVAFRACFKAIMDGKQVAMIAPTTILTEQHYITAKARFKNFGVRIACLNRFKTPKQQEEVLTKLASGEIDFVIGTHRLFSKDVIFKDLGLLVIDEEQRFGVEHKERLKLMKNNVDTLTLTATPIPRTLHMSLSGIRDISVINTPPKQRIPVQTTVTEYSDTLLRDAVMRELARDGQVFILFNRVEKIYRFAEEVTKIVPEAKIVVAHGQMPERELENKIKSFYEGESNVLIATTIIENGIDMPRANTLIVIDADTLGLSTLYQLKGRVGRGSLMAHAYFTHDENKPLSPTAFERLSALMEYTDMGSGYKIAMRDLEIRGAGNVLGAEQHGHMEKVGYELYSKLLKESLGEVTKNYEVELEIKADAYIPEEYIPSEAVRLDAYKQIAEIKDLGDRERIVKSLKELYRDIPVQVMNLIKIAWLKKVAYSVEVIKIKLEKSLCEVYLKDLNSLRNKNITDALKKYNSQTTLSFKENPVISFAFNGRTVSEQLDFVKEFLEYVA